MSEQPAEYEHVVHPAHYNNHPAGLEAWDFSSWFPGDLCIAINYLWRAGLKPGNDYQQEMKKAAAHIEHEIERLREYGIMTARTDVDELPDYIDIAAICGPFSNHISRAIWFIFEATFKECYANDMADVLMSAVDHIKDEIKQQESAA